MRQNSLREKGFTAVEGVIIVVVVALLALVGWYAFNKMGADDKKTESNTQQNKDAQEGVSTADWLVQTDSKYEVKIPDGWKLAYNTESGSMIESCGDCLTFKDGTRAVVETNSEGKDGPFAFFLKRQATGEDEALYFQGYEKTGTIAAKNVTGNAYYWLVDKDPEGIGPAKGSKVYGYAFSKGDNVVFITYTLKTGAADIRETVEQLIGTLELK